jgi:hypothetical protein
MSDIDRAVNRLELEVIHYLNTGRGYQFLLAAIHNALEAIRKAA